jgi:hypothetical protein
MLLKTKKGLRHLNPHARITFAKFGFGRAITMPRPCWLVFAGTKVGGLCFTTVSSLPENDFVVRV